MNKTEVKINRVASQQRAGQQHLCNVDVLRVVMRLSLRGLSVYAERQPFDGAGAKDGRLILARRIAVNLRHQSGGLVLVCIGPQVKPNKIERVRRIIFIYDLFKTGDGFFGVVNSASIV